MKFTKQGKLIQFVCQVSYNDFIVHIRASEVPGSDRIDQDTTLARVLRSPFDLISFGPTENGRNLGVPPKMRHLRVPPKCTQV